jgi:hypothetical protein
MNNVDIPEGKRFSHVYLERSALLKDSERFRKRLGAFINENFRWEQEQSIARHLMSELGVNIPVRGMTLYDIPAFLNESQLPDVLDSITLIWIFLNRISPTIAPSWKNFVECVFKEENLGYKLDPECGVHYFVDEEFEKNRLSSLSCLTNPRYVAVAVAFEDSYSKLDLQPADTKGSVRSIFEALEILYNLIVHTEEKTRLDSHGVIKNLKPMIQSLYNDDKTACIAAEHLLDGFCDWIEALQMYRHGQEVEEPIDLPIGLAIQIISSGASYIRWLVEVDSFSTNSR